MPPSQFQHQRLLTIQPMHNPPTLQCFLRNGNQPVEILLGMQPNLM